MKLKTSDDHIHFFAMRRSGHHAVMYWCFDLLPFKLKHYNNCTLLDDDFSVYSQRDIFDIHSERLGETKIVCNFEDFNLFDSFKLPKNKIRVLILRDAYNNFASRIKSTDAWKIQPNHRQHVTPWLWKQHAKEYLGETSYLGKDCIKILYNNWFLDANYRKEIAHKHFGGLSSDCVSNVPIWSSSFDEAKFQGRAEQMSVINRWKQLKKSNHKYMYQSILNDPEIKKLNEAIFGKVVKGAHFL